MNRQTVTRIVPFVILTVVFAALLYRAEHKAETGISRVDRHITEVTSPCLRYGARSRQCKRAFEAAVATIDHPEACAILRKAGLRVGSCEGTHLAVERHGAAVTAGREATAPSRAPGAAPEGGDDNSSPHTGSSQPGRHEGGSDGHGQPSHPHAPSVPGEHGGGEAVPSPASPPSTGPSQSSSSTTERTTETTTVEPPSPQAEPPARTAVGGLTESIGATVEGLGETAGGMVEGVEATTCTLAKALCHE